MLFHFMFPLPPSEPPRATVTPTGPLRVKVGEPINLECQAAGEPLPSVTWHRLDNNRKMILSSLVPMDSNAVMQVHGLTINSSLCVCVYCHFATS